MTPVSLRIFVVEPGGLCIIDKSNRIGKALPELALTGVYLLLGPRPIGE